MRIDSGRTHRGRSAIVAGQPSRRGKLSQSQCQPKPSEATCHAGLVPASGTWHEVTRRWENIPSRTDGVPVRMYSTGTRDKLRNRAIRHLPLGCFSAWWALAASYAGERRARRKGKGEGEGGRREAGRQGGRRRKGVHVSSCS